MVNRTDFEQFRRLARPARTARVTLRDAARSLRPRIVRETELTEPDAPGEDVFELEPRGPAIVESPFSTPEAEVTEATERNENMAELLHVGIDLGTSRSAISASNGERFVVDSFVGWPVDMVARKVLKREVLIGHEAVSNRTMLDLHRPLERGLLKEGSEKDVEAVRELLKHLLRLVGVSSNGRVHASNVRAVVGVPAAALRTNKQYLRNSMKGIVDSLLIVSEPFAVAYGLDALLHTMIIDIGAGTTDFCVMKGRYPTEEDQRTLTVAGDSIDTQLLKLIEERYPQANVTVFMVREWKEKFSFVNDSRERIMVTAPVRGVPTELDITAEIKTACETLLAPVVETMLDLLARVEPEFQERVRNNIILSGGGGLIRGLGTALETALRSVGGGKVRYMEDPVFVGSDGGLALAMDAPEGDWEKLTA
ncbi:MAG TPA: rod shape-determining protein [Thermoanaerobaculia bacterium]|jgi:rod shape-determining protein MreB